MALLNWNRKKYSVGDATIDAQHASFIRLLNRFHAAMLRGSGSSVTGSLLRQLIAAVREHFSTEEEMMTSSKYPGLAHHRAEHQRAAASLIELNDRYERGESHVSISVLRRVRDWLSAHMLDEDGKLGRWLKEHPQVEPPGPPC